MDKKFRINQWSGHYSPSLTDTNADRCFQERLGCSVSRDKNWGPVVNERTGVSYKSFRTFSNEICTSNLQKNDEFQISTYPSRQPNCPELPLTDGRDEESGTSQSFEGDLGLSFQTSDHDYCGVPHRLPESSGRLGVKKPKEFHRMELMSASIPENLPEGGSTRDRSICFLVVQSAPSLLLMEARPKQFGLRCFATNLVPQTSLRFSPIFTDTQGKKEGRVGESPFFDTDSTNLVEPDMVPTVNSFVNEKSPTLTSTFKSLKELSRETSKSNNEVYCLDYYRQHLAKKGISERASNLILLSRREGTNSNYCSSWNK